MAVSSLQGICGSVQIRITGQNHKPLETVQLVLGWALRRNLTGLECKILTSCSVLLCTGKVNMEKTRGAIFRRARLKFSFALLMTADGKPSDLLKKNCMSGSSLN